MTGIEVLLDEVSPYQSRRVVVECDSRTTSAYLLDARGRIRVPVWLANHEIAPRAAEPGGSFEGRAPLMLTGKDAETETGQDQQERSA